ncbi:hypothetical protein DMUE_0729 [Dictyocoela muelleri]|nr:hypothetical protein DMUE_0729 [Dictyocoela muelleri]
MNDVLEYFKINFLIKDNKSAKHMLTWNLNDRILQNIPTSTNCLEAWHGHINNNLTSPHPSYDKLILILKREEEKTRVVAMNLKNGVVKYKKRVDNLNQVYIIENYGHYTIMNFLTLL